MAATSTPTSKRPAPPMPATRWASTGAATNRSSTACKPCCRAQRWATPRSSCTTSTLTTTGTGWPGPHNAPFRLRVVKRSALGYDPDTLIPIARLRQHIPADLAADIADLLASGATYAGRPVQPGHIAVIVNRHEDARACRDALASAGIAAIYSGDSDVFESQAAKDWLCLLEAFDAPHRSGLVRAAACTLFFGATAETLAAEGDALTDRVAETLREWAGHARRRGVAAVFEAAQRAGMGRRVLAEQGGERHMTDLAHITQLLHQTAHRERYSMPALRDWLRRQCDTRARVTEHSRRLDSDADAVQIMTVFVAKGLQFPIVYLPFAFNRNARSDDILLYHDDDTRCLYIGGQDRSAERQAAKRLNLRENAHDNLRATYVALTRAQSQVVTWWAPPKTKSTAAFRGCCAVAVSASLRCPTRVNRASPTTTRGRCSNVGRPRAGRRWRNR
ncbi:uvrD-like helicase C-terminal domain protein [Mycobacterium xenopi 3993]|nr:uvrD-like helicase C-terminal domain protein [Mycobacterium xenopi 3993]